MRDFRVRLRRITARVSEGPICLPVFKQHDYESREAMEEALAAWHRENPDITIPLMVICEEQPPELPAPPVNLDTT